MNLSVNTGAIKVAVTNENGTQIGEFEFSPLDYNIVRRYGKVVDFFNSVEFADGLTDEEQLAETSKLSDNICEQFDYLLGYKVSAGIFGHCSPLTVIQNGDFYFMNVLEGIAGLIENVMRERVEKKLKKVEKATAKYTK